MRVYLIEGISGTGKTTLAKELSDRGYDAVDADSSFGYFGNPKTGLPLDDREKREWMWDRGRFESLIDSLASQDGVIFVCGGSFNYRDFFKGFDRIFTLHADDKTLIDRIRGRNNGNRYGKRTEELLAVLDLNVTTVARSREMASTLVDATRPVKEVADEILWLIGMTLTSHNLNPI